MYPHEIQDLFSKIMLSFVLFGIPIIVIAIVVIFLIKPLISKEKNARSNDSSTITTRVIEKRENIAIGSHGTLTYYYVTFEERIDLCVPRRIYKKVNAQDLVKLTYIGDKFISLSVVEKSTEASCGKQVIGHISANSPSNREKD